MLKFRKYLSQNSNLRGQHITLPRVRGPGPIETTALRQFLDMDVA